VIKFGRPVIGDVDARLPRVVEKLACDEAVEAIWLFGSRARGEADTLSDVDIAVLASPGLSSGELFDRQIDWTTTAVGELATDEVGVQILNRLPVAVRHSIIRDARLLWARTPEIAADFVAHTVKEYLDLQPYLARYDRDLFRRAASGTLR
jgi:hypothetical protein